VRESTVDDRLLRLARTSNPPVYKLMQVRILFPSTVTGFLGYSGADCSLIGSLRSTKKALLAARRPKPPTLSATARPLSCGEAVGGSRRRSGPGLFLAGHLHSWAGDLPDLAASADPIPGSAFACTENRQMAQMRVMRAARVGRDTRYRGIALQARSHQADTPRNWSTRRTTAPASTAFGLARRA